MTAGSTSTDCILMLEHDAKMQDLRTTITIDDGLYRALKERAARSGRTVAAVLEDLVRVGLNPPQRAEASRFVIRPTGAGGLRPGVDLSSSASVYDAIDDGIELDALR